MPSRTPAALLPSIALTLETLPDRAPGRSQAQALRRAVRAGGPAHRAHQCRHRAPPVLWAQSNHILHAGEGQLLLAPPIPLLPTPCHPSEADWKPSPPWSRGQPTGPRPAIAGARQELPCGQAAARPQINQGEPAAFRPGAMVTPTGGHNSPPVNCGSS